METTIKLIAVAVLILLTAFFVASEFAIVKVRKTRFEARAAEGEKKAENAMRILNDLDYYLSACQLGITITALGLGWLGEPTLEVLVRPVLDRVALPEGVTHTLSFVLAFFVITFLHVVLGELAPKTMAIQKAEKITLFLSKPLMLYSKVMYPLIWLLNGSANVIVRMLGFQTAKESDDVHSEEELRHILTKSYQKGEINRSEYTYVDRIFEFDNRTAKEIMIPRTEMSVIDVHRSVTNAIREVKHNRYTRYPIIEGDKDKVIGIIHMKELLYDDAEQQNSLRPFLRPVMKVFENIPIHDLLVKMQKNHTHMAVLIDEYGGTAGIVTVEDILEEIVGEIRDEFDAEEERDIKRLKNGHFLIEGKTPIQDINEFFDIQLNHNDIDTISGWIYTRDFEAKEGTVIQGEGYSFKIVDLVKGQIKKVEMWKDESKK
ncbi:hemolysin family protein [Halobacillus karajensis]|uniref:Hemolysin C n=1 Tax=Halobacillus karajensis TaxID=195088 RepID=A0A024P2V3_9BACI|nr:hemolysin family protein [Halobacillus karajensis]CDQ19923.1 Hemolysin C [Halobacillus karajensis]CDQ22383.1 Hemolysin C [Halobacillus karajensis]CDQ28226.1 Hemolysin C [Halobacillus karajensis]